MRISRCFIFFNFIAAQKSINPRFIEQINIFELLQFKCKPINFFFVTLASFKGCLILYHKSNALANKAISSVCLNLPTINPINIAISGYFKTKAYILTLSSCETGLLSLHRHNTPSDQTFFNTLNNLALDAYPYFF